MAFEDLVAELERSHSEAQERMSDPSVFSDHRTAAEAGRKLKELEAPYKLAQEWRAAAAGPQGARARPRPPREGAGAAGAGGGARGGGGVARAARAPTP